MKRYLFIALVTKACLFLPLTHFGQVQFVEISDQAAIEHVHIAPSLMGGGVAVFDFNRDGLEDFYLTGGNYEDRLFKNLGDGTFEEISENTPIYDTRVINTMGVTTGDIDNDGFREIFVTTERDEPDILFYNNGDGTFTNISESAGIKDMAWSMGAVFTDINMDGWLDIYVINYIKDPDAIIDEETGDVTGFSHTCFQNFLYINQGDLTFIESADQYGLNDNGCGLAVTATDLDEDGFPDIYVANDFGEWILPNKVFRNEFPEKSFSDVSEAYKLDDEVFGMSIATGDYDRDGMLDYYVSNIGRNVLHKRTVSADFIDMTDAAEVACAEVEGLNSTSWGSAFLDVDNDGYEDLFVANGYIPSAKFIETSKTDPDKLFHNNHDGTFSDISSFAGIGYEGISRGMGYTDFDLDGDLDIILNVTQRVLYNPENIKLYENHLDNGNHWLKLFLEGVEVNRDAYGAHVSAYAGNTVYLRELSSSGTHASQHSSLIHIGLGNLDHLDSLVVTWPGGKKQVFEDIRDIDNTLQITEDKQNYEILGCLDPQARNYAPGAGKDFGCYYGEEVTSLPESINTILNIYPNPASSDLYIELPGGSFTYNIISPEGKRVLSGKLRSEREDQRIHVKELPAGLYILLLMHRNGETFQEPFIKN